MPMNAYDWLAADLGGDAGSKDAEARLRLFCIPAAGAWGTTALFSGWGAALRPHGIDVVTLLPGGPKRARRVMIGEESPPAATEVTTLVDGLVSVLATQSDKPYALFAHSAGVSLALALVRELQARGRTLPIRIFVSGLRAPQLQSPIEGDAWRREDDAMLALIKEWSGGDKGITDDELLSGEAGALTARRVRADIVVAEHAFFEGGPKALSSAAVAGIQVPICAVAGQDDAEAGEGCLEAWAACAADGSVEAGGFLSRRFPGGHFFWTDESAGKDKAAAAAAASASAALLTFVGKVVVEDLNASVARGKALVATRNMREMAYPDTACLHDLFLAQAAKTPDHVALVDPAVGVRMTYAEVEAATATLARYLVAHGAGRGKVVGILMERSVEYVLGYIAAHRAGAAYMPIEIVYPPDLIKRVLNETKAPVVLTFAHLAARLPKNGFTSVLSMDAGWDAALGPGGARAGEAPPIPASHERAQPDDLAYVVMSSGTTGTPKGICCPHRGAVHSYHWRFEHWPFKANDRMGCAVFYVWEVFRPLCRGYPAYVIGDDVIYDPEALSSYCAANSITRILFTPSLLQLILDTMEPSDVKTRFAKLRICWLCGEVVTAELRARFVALLPDCLLLNLYSISECHDVSVANLSAPALGGTHNDAYSPKYASCGEVMENVQIHILNPETLEPVAFGSPGEVFVGGPCIALGYLNMPAKTAARFVPVPKPLISAHAHRRPDFDARLYRTGDRGRFLPNGELELVGRCDFMVKIRGYSVVLGAVEVAITQHPEVATAVVLTHGAEGTDKKLVAYIVPEVWGRKTPSAPALRAWLADRLPMYAIPSILLLIDAIPISAIGKLDRKALPSPDEGRRLTETHHELLGSDGTGGSAASAASAATAGGDAAGAAAAAADDTPLTETEVRVEKIWRTLLGLAPEQQVRAGDSFFALGGHSLLAIRMLSAVRRDTGVKLPLGAVLAEPSLRAVAAALAGKLAGEEEKEAAGSSAAAQGERGMDLPGQVILEQSIYPAATRKTGHARYRRETAQLRPRTLLLTGATGFFGSFLAHRLLTATEVETIYCLVRQADGQREQAFGRLETSLRRYGLWTEAAAAGAVARLVPVCGDLSKPLLGIASAEWSELAATVDAIIHNGAEVNLAKSFEALKASNVMGTHEVLRLAVTNSPLRTKVKPVHFVSSNGIFPFQQQDKTTADGSAEAEASGSSGEPVVWAEAADVTAPTIWSRLHDGYGQSKWVAEQLCVEARRRGLPVAVYRPGTLGGSSTTGAWQEGDAVRSLLAACRELGAAPTQTPWKIDLTPVDFAAAALVDLAVSHPNRALGQTFHVQNPQPAVAWDTMAAWLAETGTWKLVPLQDWLALLSDAAVATPATMIPTGGGAGKENDDDVGGGSKNVQRLDAALSSFTPYWVEPPYFTSTELHRALRLNTTTTAAAAAEQQQKNVIEACAPLTATLLGKYVAAMKI